MEPLIKDRTQTLETCSLSLYNIESVFCPLSEVPLLTVLLCALYIHTCTIITDYNNGPVVITLPHTEQTADLYDDM